MGPQWGGDLPWCILAPPANPGPLGHHAQAGTSISPPCPQAFSNFYYTFHFLNLTSRQPLAAVNATIWEFCQRPWKLVGGPGHPPPTLGLPCLPGPQAQTSPSRDLAGPHPGQGG